MAGSKLELLVETLADAFNKTYPTIGVKLEAHDTYANQGLFLDHHSIYPSLDVSEKSGADVSFFFQDYSRYGNKIGALFYIASESFPQNRVSLRRRNGGRAVVIQVAGADLLTSGPLLTQQVTEALAKLVQLAEPVFVASVEEDAYDDDLVEALLAGVAEAPEGRPHTVEHLKRERSKRLVESKKEQVLKEKGKLACEVCEFDFQEMYGERGSGFVECHHTKPVKTLVDGSITHVKDLAVVCSNCHRMIHTKQPWLTTQALRELIHRSPTRRG